MLSWIQIFWLTRYFIMTDMPKGYCFASSKIQIVISEAIAIEYLDIVILHALEAELTLEHARKPLRKLVKMYSFSEVGVPRDGKPGASLFWSIYGGL